MAKHLLITRPDHDYLTRYLSAWAKKFFSLVEEKGYSIIHLDGKRANLKEFESIISKRNPCFIVINGHGDDSSITGYENEPLLIANHNSSLLEGKVTYAISCKSACILGKVVGQHPNTTFIGYQEDFILLYLEKFRTRPAEDKLAELFLNPSNIIVTTLIKGHPAKEAVSRAKQEYLRNIQKLLTSKVKSEDSSTLRYLVWDMRNLILCGEKDKKIN